MFTHSGGDDEICPYATFHLLGFREEMDPQQAGNNFQTFPYQNGHGSQQNFVNSPASRSMVSGTSPARRAAVLGFWLCSRIIRNSVRLAYFSLFCVGLVN